MGRHDSHKSRSGGSSSKKRNDKKKREDDDDYEKRRHRKHRDDKYDDDDDDYGSSSRHKRKRRHDDDEEDDRRHRHHRHNRRSSKDDDDESDDGYSGRDRKRSKKEKRHHDRHRRGDDDDDDDSRRRKGSSSRHHNKPKSKGSSRRRDEDDSSGEERRHHSRSKDSKRHKKDKKSHKEKKSSSSKKSADKTQNKATTIKPNPPDKSKLYPMSPISGRKPDTLIDPIKDYFTYHEQFWVYLYRNIGIAFNDLTSEESREYFQKFANEYNDGNYLEAEYYLSKMPSEILEECKTTKHSWSFNTKMTDTEKKGLQQLQQNITKQTEYRNKTVGNPKAAVATRAPLPNPSPYCQPAATTAMVPTNPQNQWKKTAEERLEERRANKRLRDHVRNAEEELDGGPKDFRERQLAKKREKSNKMHGGSRDRMAEPEISDDVLYGGDNTTDNYQAALAKEKARKAKRSQNQANRVTELKNKEKERQENMLKMLGMQNLKPGQKITIAPRKDG